MDRSFGNVIEVNTLESSELPASLYSPTTGVIIGNYFYYITNAQVRSFDKNGNIFQWEKL